MNKNLLAVTFFCLALSCTKQPVSTGNLSTTVQDAKGYFEKVVLSSSGSMDPQNPRAKWERLINWKAATVNFSGTDELVSAPVTFSGHHILSADISGGQFFDVNDLSFIVIRKTANNRFSYENLTYVPDTAADPTTLSGIVLSEDWQGNTLRKPMRLRKWDGNTEQKET